MATLKAQILSDLRTVVADASLTDMTNQRGSGSSEDTAVTERAAAYADAIVRERLGASIDGTDLEAVEIGVSLAVIMLNQRFTMAFQAGGTPQRAQVMNELNDIQRRRRIAGTRPSLYKPDYEALDRLYRINSYEDGE